MSVRSLELRREAGNLVEEARKIIALAESEKRQMSDEESKRFDMMHDDAEKKIAEAGRQERQERADHNITEPAARNSLRFALPTGATAEGSVIGELRNRHFAQFLRGTLHAVPYEERATLQQDIDAGGGFFTVPETFIDQIIKNVDDIFPIYQMGTVFPCDRNGTLGAVALTGDVGEFEFGAGELTAAAEDTNVAFGKRELKPRDLKPKLIKVSRPLMNNPRIDIVSFVAGRVAYAKAAGLETAFMTGAGAFGPLGMFVASDDGVPTAQDVATGSATGITANGLFNAQGKLKPQYQAAAKWLFHRTTVTEIRKLVTGEGQYLWQPGLQLGQANLLLGKEVIQSEKVPSTLTSNLYAGMYADFRHYWIADAVSMSMQVLDQPYATTNQVGLLFRDMACDGMPVVAEAFARLKCAAS